MQLGYFQKMGISAAVDMLADSAVSTILTRANAPVPKSDFGKTAGAFGLFALSGIVGAFGSYLLDRVGEEKADDCGA